MEGHTQDIIYTIITILPIIAFVWQINESKDRKLEKRFDAMDKRFDTIQEQLNQINQNHIEHLMTLHALPAHRQKVADKASD